MSERVRNRDEKERMLHVLRIILVMILIIVIIFLKIINPKWPVCCLELWLKFNLFLKQVKYSFHMHDNNNNNSITNNNMFFI